MTKLYVTLESNSTWKQIGKYLSQTTIKMYKNTEK